MLLRKIFHSLLILLGVVILVFMLFQWFGDPAKMIAGQSGDKKTMDNIRKELNLDKPKWQQLLMYLNNLSPISIHTSHEIENKKLKGFFIGHENKIGIKLPYLGMSYQSKRPVTTLISESLPGTIVLAFTAMFIAVFFGMSLGVAAALKKDTWIDRSTLFIGILGISTPSFFMAILLAYFLGIYLHAYTGLDFFGSLFVIDDTTGERHLQLKNLILPAITLGIRPMAIITQLTRSAMLDVWHQDYIRTAFAKGLKKNLVWRRHALRNAFNPILTTIGGWFGELLAGAFFVEFIFGWKGMGKLTIDSLEKLDYPVVTGTVLCSALIFIFINLITDWLLKKIDPRIS